MPLYFAYGANMDVVAMRERCPRSVPLGPSRLAGFSFLITEDGYGSIRPGSGDAVFGLAWTLSLRDIAALDRYESLETGLYRKQSLPVQVAGKIVMALVYVARSDVPGVPAKGYMEAVVAAAVDLGFPVPYVRNLRRWLPQPLRSRH